MTAFTSFCFQPGFDLFQSLLDLVYLLLDTVLRTSTFFPPLLLPLLSCVSISPGRGITLKSFVCKTSLTGVSCYQCPTNQPYPCDLCTWGNQSSVYVLEAGRCSDLPTAYKEYQFYFFFKVQTQRRATGFDMKQEQRPNRVMQKLVGDLFVTALNTAAELQVIFSA